MAPRGQDAANGARIRGTHRHLRYGGPWFSAASALPLGGPIRYGQLPSLVAAAVRHPRRTAALIALLARTRSEHPVLSGSLAGEALRAYFNEQVLGVFPRHRLCRGVLILPEDHSEYLHGRRRQALRTNLRRAEFIGTRCEIVKDRQRVVDEIREVDRHDDAEVWLRVVARPEITLMVARDKRGTPVAWAGVVLDDSVCLIALTGSNSKDARWALHDYLVRTLIARGARYLVANGGGPFGALGYTANVQHYQHLLGYELRHLVPASPTELAKHRRLASRARDRNPRRQSP